MYRKFNDLFSGPSNIAGPGICQPLSSFPRRVNLPEASGTDCSLGGRVHPQIAWAKRRAALRDGDREQKVVELNSKVSVREEPNKNKKVRKERPTKIIEK
jgi:hypothetical protein